MILSLIYPLLPPSCSPLLLSWPCIFLFVVSSEQRNAMQWTQPGYHAVRSHTSILGLSKVSYQARMIPRSYQENGVLRCSRLWRGLRPCLKASTAQRSAEMSRPIPSQSASLLLIQHSYLNHLAARLVSFCSKRQSVFSYSCLETISLIRVARGGQSTAQDVQHNQPSRFR